MPGTPRARRIAHLTPIALDLGFDLSALGGEVAERPYVTLGFTAFVLGGFFALRLPWLRRWRSKRV